MTPQDEWAVLCKEYAMWHKMEFEAFAAVRVAFYHGADGTGDEPSETELCYWADARSELAAIEARMDALIDKTFGKAVRNVSETAALLRP